MIKCLVGFDANKGCILEINCKTEDESLTANLIDSIENSV